MTAALSLAAMQAVLASLSSISLQPPFVWGVNERCQMLDVRVSGRSLVSRPKAANRSSLWFEPSATAGCPLHPACTVLLAVPRDAEQLEASW
ncbi:hypothetical protein [Variovorax boronicumulans]|uniref:hypothetical protein n=1 Tax=Variovorax boronicumulans TaxID=436515 RepID=UPI00339A48BC